MAKQYSIAQARKELARLVDEAEAGAEVQLTRRGRPVAVVVSVGEFQQLKQPRTFGDAYQAFRRRFPAKKGGIDPKFFSALRDKTRGRKVDL
jgi:prevent-host-death family protein